MTTNWVEDIAFMHKKYGFHEKIKDLDQEKLRKLLDFRIKFLEEELNELRNSLNSDDVVDALIDLCVVAVGTLDLFRIDSYRAWNDVLYANLAKEVGVKATRPNPLNLPDLIKPVGWVAPSHEGNHGLLTKTFGESI